MEALKANSLASQSDLIIYSDAPRKSEHIRGVMEVRRYLKSINGFNSIKIIERSKNFGLKKSIISGVSEVLSQYESAIILEDDLIVSDQFLRFMNDGLEIYKNDEVVVCISGYVYPIDQNVLPETFFIQGADCWGWATWSRAWKIFNEDANILIAQFNAQKIIKFTFNNSFPFFRMLKSEAEKDGISSWAILWYASTFLKQSLTLYPKKSLVKNIGNDGTGTHHAENRLGDQDVEGIMIELTRDVIIESTVARHEFEKFFKRRLRGFPERVISYIKRRLNSLELLRRLLRSIAPPLLLNSLKTILVDKNSKIIYQGPFLTWEEAKANSYGYEDENIFSRVLEVAENVKNCNILFERDSVGFFEYSYSNPILIGLLNVAANNKGRVNLIDFGGSLASSYFRHYPFLYHLPELKWNIVEQRQNVINGSALFLHHYPLYFYGSIDECLRSSNINAALFSASIQYLEDSYSIISKIFHHESIEQIIIDRIPITSQKNDVFIVQEVSPLIYKGSYPLRIFSRQKFLELFSGEWILLLNEISPEGWQVAENGVNFVYESFIFQRSSMGKPGSN